MNEIMANKENEYFVLPNIPDKIEITIAQAGTAGFKGEAWKQINEDVLDAEMGTYVILMNSFEELEPTYAKEYKKVKNDIATNFEKEALAKYYFIVSLKKDNYLEYKYKKQEYLLQIDYETASNIKKETLLKTYKQFYVSKMLIIFPLEH